MLHQSDTQQSGQFPGLQVVAQLVDVTSAVENDRRARRRPRQLLPATVTLVHVAWQQPSGSERRPPELTATGEPWRRSRVVPLQRRVVEPSAVFPPRSLSARRPSRRSRLSGCMTGPQHLHRTGALVGRVDAGDGGRRQRVGPASARWRPRLPGPCPPGPLRISKRVDDGEQCLRGTMASTLGDTGRTSRWHRRRYVLEDNTDVLGHLLADRDHAIVDLPEEADEVGPLAHRTLPARSIRRPTIARRRTRIWRDSAWGRGGADEAGGSDRRRGGRHDAAVVGGVRSRGQRPRPDRPPAQRSRGGPGVDRAVHPDDGQPGGRRPGTSGASQRRTG